MIVCIIIFAACSLFAARAFHVQAVPNPHTPQSTEQLETGFKEMHGKPSAPYQIRLLPVSSFPQLPALIARELDAKGCLIPQTYEAHEPENVIRGSFEKSGSNDWAVLCSVKGITNLYVFFGSNLAEPIALRSQADSKWLGKDWSQDYGSAWGISTMSADVMPRVDQFDHDGIEDAFIEQSAVVHYYVKGRWASYETSQ